MVSTSACISTIRAAVARYEVRLIKMFGNDDWEEISGIHSNTRYEIVYIIHGSGTHCIDMACQPIMDGQLLFVCPNQLHQLKTETEIEGIVLTFESGFARHDDLTYHPEHFLQLVSRYAGIGTLKLSALANELVGELLFRMWRGQYDSMGDIINSAYFRILLLSLSSHLDILPAATCNGRTAKILMQFNQLLDHKFRHQKMVSEYASDLAVTSNYLNTVVKKMTGHSARYLIQQKILLEAKRLVIKDGASLKEISYSLGFNDSAHFSKYFKSVNGGNFRSFISRF